MGKKGRVGVLKRQRELKKVEKAALKRERRERRSSEERSEIPTQEDLAAYGIVDEEESPRTTSAPASSPESPHSSRFAQRAAVILFVSLVDTSVGQGIIYWHSSVYAASRWPRSGDTVRREMGALGPSAGRSMSTR